MTSSANTRDVALRPAPFAAEEELALTGFLAGYSGLTREAYMLDLRQYVAWCAERRVALFGARRADIEAFGRHLETAGRARAMISRRLCTIACFYRYAEQEDFIAKSPAVKSGARSSTTNHTQLDWTATKSVPCSWLPVSETRRIMRSSACSHSMDFEFRKQSERTSSRSDSSEDIAPSRSCARAARP
jgi:Phage integrase, N-terminal SAM-like domain